MQSQQSLPKEIRYTQYLVYASGFLSIIATGIFYAILYMKPLNLFAGVSVLVDLLFNLFWFFLGWQLGRLRSWARITLMVFAVIGILGAGSQLLIRLFARTLERESILYQVYYYADIFISLAVFIVLLYYLTRPAIRDVFKSQHLTNLASKNKWPSSPPVG